MMNNAFASNLIVRAHATVLREGWAGYVRHHRLGEWDFHPTVDTVNEPVETVTLKTLVDRDPTLHQLQSLAPMSQAWRWERNDEFQTSRLPAGPTYFFRIEALPSPDHPEHDTIGGAIVNCWIRIESPNDALEIVKRELANALWIIESLYGPEIHTDRDYENDETDVKYYMQAQTDGEVFVFHQYPPQDA